MTTASTPPQTVDLSLFATSSSRDRAANLLASARALAAHLARSRPLDRKLVSGVMVTTFGGSDAQGLWSWRDAYQAIKGAIVLQIRRLAPQVARLGDAPAGIAALLATVGALGRTHCRRSARPWGLRAWAVQFGSDLPRSVHRRCVSGSARGQISQWKAISVSPVTAPAASKRRSQIRPRPARSTATTVLHRVP